MSRRTPRRAGRPSGLTPEVEDALLAAITGGVPLTHAARYAGIGQSTFHRWMDRGETEAARLADDDTAQLDPDETPYRQLYDRVARARSQVAVRNVALLQKSAQGGFKTKERTRRYRDPGTGQLVTETETDFAPPDWRAAAWLLERSFAGDFTKTPRLELTGADGGPIPVEHSLGDVTSLAARLQQFAERRAAGELPAADGDEVYDAELVDEAS